MSELLKSPVVPSAILNFFSNQPDFAALAGDMSEEFHQRAQISGAKAAKLWYWREAFRNAWALTAREVLRTPVRTTIIALGCVLAANFVPALYFRIRNYPRSVGIVLSHFQYWDPMELVFNRSDRNTMLLLQFVTPLAMGRIGSRLIPGREWALALLFTFVSVCVALPAACYLWVVLKLVLPVPLREFMIAAIALPLSGFWMGSLWIRQSRSVSC